MRTSKYLHKIVIIIKIIVAFFLCAVLVGNLYLIGAQLADKNSLPKIFGFAQVVVMSGSMLPAIEAGDMIIIKEQKKYEENDIVTYRRDQILITHRVIELTQSGVVTKGDANNVNDNPVPLSDIEGKVVLCIPNAGNIILFLKKPTGILAVSCMVLLLYMISHIVQKLKRQKK
ncbi:MAG TPA: signal peptidase I [Anaerovoracaceae bacterium]|nr:signal peptidase I [Anaerovoracaceae bacterium]